MQQINPQLVIDELAKRLQQATLENVVLSAQLAEIQKRHEAGEETVIGSDITEE